MKFSLAILALAHAKTYEERIVENLNDCGFFEDELVLVLGRNKPGNLLGRQKFMLTGHINRSNKAPPTQFRVGKSILHCSNELRNFSVSNHVPIDFNMPWNSIPTTSKGLKFEIFEVLNVERASRQSSLKFFDL